jgi:hypothetical protein
MARNLTFHVACFRMADELREVFRTANQAARCFRYVERGYKNNGYISERDAKAFWTPRQGTVLVHIDGHAG